MGSLRVSNNYFEANNSPISGIVKFIDESTNRTTDLCTDVLLDGSAYHGVDAGLSLPNITLGGSQPCTTAIVSANYHNPGQSRLACSQYFGLAAFAAEDVLFQANSIRGCGKYHAQNCTAVGKLSPNATGIVHELNAGWGVSKHPVPPGRATVSAPAGM